MRIIASLLIAAALSGCAWSAKGLMKGDVEDTYTSSHKAQEVAGCISSTLMGSNPAFPEGDGHWVVVRKNGYGVPIVRWDIYDTTEGSRIDFRRSMAMMSGEKKVEENCL